MSCYATIDELVCVILYLPSVRLWLQLKRFFRPTLVSKARPPPLKIGDTVDVSGVSRSS